MVAEKPLLKLSPLDTMVLNMRKFAQKTTVKLLLFIWIASSITYLVLFKTFDNEAEISDSDKEAKNYPLEEAGPVLAQPVLAEPNQISHLPKVWSCDDLDKKIQQTSYHLSFDRSEVKGKYSYCLSMMESFQRCIGFVPDNTTFLLPNPFLSYHSRDDFRANVVKYRQAHIYFVHVMKSSGTSMETLLRQLIPSKRGNSNVSPKSRYQPVLSYYCSNMINFYRDAIAQPSVKLMSLDKRSFGLHRMVPQPGYYVTVLRDPVTRFVSMYQYIKQGRYPQLLGDQLFIDVFESDDLDDFLVKTKDKQIPFFDNHSIRMFQFDKYPDLFSTFSGGPDTYIKGVTKIIAVNDSHYTEALKNLRKCAFVGITEDFRKTEDMLTLMLSLNLGSEIKANVNSNYDKKSISNFQRDAIEKRVYYDRKLYNEAKQIFDAQLRAYYKYA